MGFLKVFYRFFSESLTRKGPVGMIISFFPGFLSRF